MSTAAAVVVEVYSIRDLRLFSIINFTVKRKKSRTREEREIVSREWKSVRCVLTSELMCFVWVSTAAVWDEAAAATTTSHSPNKEKRRHFYYKKIYSRFVFKISLIRHRCSNKFVRREKEVICVLWLLQMSGNFMFFRLRFCQTKTPTRKLSIWIELFDWMATNSNQ